MTLLRLRELMFIVDGNQQPLIVQVPEAAPCSGNTCSCFAEHRLYCA